MEGEKISEIGSGGIRTRASLDLPGLHVLVVDDDPACLKIIETMLRICKYEVVAARQAIDALNLIQEREGRFDLVLTDVHMPGMDGFQLLDRIDKEFKIPVILMSVDEKHEVIAKGLQSGACFYISKPITLNDIQNLWQLVLRKRYDDMQEIEERENFQQTSPPEIITMGENIECASSVNYEGRWTQQEGKRKMPKESDEEENGKDDSTSQKKKRVVWNSDLHNRFLEAIDQIGLDKAFPKKILEVMNIPGITRENVASHLQKYRQFIKRLEERRTMEPRPPRCLTNGPLNSSFPPGHSTLMFNSQKGYPQFSDQLRSLMSLQKVIKGNIHEGRLTVSINHDMPPDGPSRSLNQGVSSSNSLAEKPFPTSNQGILQKPRHGNSSMSSSLNQQNDSSYLAIGMGPYGNRMGATLHGNNSAGNVRGNNAMPMVHQQTQATIRYLNNGPVLDHNNFSTLNRQGQNNLSFIRGNMGVGSMRSFGNFNQGQGSNYSKNSCNAGIQMNSFGGLAGLSHTRPVGSESSKDLSENYNLMNEFCRGNTNVTAIGNSPSIPQFNEMNSEYDTQGVAAASSGFPNARQFPALFTNAVVQQRQPPPSDQLHQHGGDNTINGLYMPRGTGTYQQQGGEEVVHPKLHTSTSVGGQQCSTVN